jgi:MFS family permease
MTLSSKFKGSLAATSAVAGILAGVLGSWLSGHWQWGVACAFLVLLGVAAGVEAFRASRKSKDSAEEPSLSGNPSYGDALVAGRDIYQSRSISNIDQSKTTSFRLSGGIATVVAILALGGAAGGTIYVSQRTTVMIESPQNLANDGNHSSPEAAVKGFLGDLFLGDMPGACGYLLPDEQSTCNQAYASSSSNASSTNSSFSGDTGVGNAIVNGTLALVPVVGRICSSGTCQSFFRNGLPPGMSFEAAFHEAMSSNQPASFNLAACEEVGNSWYISSPGV